MGVKQVVWTTGVVVFLGVAGARAGAQPAGEPKLVLSQTSWDFGTVRHPQPIECALTLTNEGSAVLRITNVQSNCTCMAVEPSKTVLEPAESTSVKITYFSKGRQGRVTSKATISSNDKANPEVVLRVTGVVKRAVEEKPLGGAMFHILDPGQVHSRTIRLVNKEPEPMRLEITRSPSDRFSAELREIRAGREYELVVTTRPPLPRRAIRENLEIRTGLEVEPTLTLPVRVLVMDRVNVSPSAVFVNSALTERSQRIVRIKYFGDDPAFKVTGVVCEDPNITIKLQEPARPVKPRKPPAGTLWANIVVPLDVGLPPAVQVPARGVPVKVFTNDPEYPEVKFVITSDTEVLRELIQEARNTSQRRPPAPGG